MKKYTQLINQEPIFEMATMNKSTQSSGPLPCNKYKVEIYSNDHVPPHFHVLYNGSNIEFYIETGEFYKYKKNSKELNSKDFNDLCNRVNEWLFENKNIAGDTYQRACYNAWIMWYDTKGFSNEFINKMKS